MPSWAGSVVGSGWGKSCLGCSFGDGDLQEGPWTSCGVGVGGYPGGHSFEHGMCYVSDGILVIIIGQALFKK